MLRLTVYGSLATKLLLALLLAAPSVALAPIEEAEACIHSMKGKRPYKTPGGDTIEDAPTVSVAQQIKDAEEYAEQGASALALRSIARAYPELITLDKSYAKPNKIKRDAATGHTAELYASAARIAAVAIARSEGRVHFNSSAKDNKDEKRRLKQLGWAADVLRHAVNQAPEDVALKNQLVEALLAHPKRQDEGLKLYEELERAEALSDHARQARQRVGAQAAARPVKS